MSKPASMLLGLAAAAVMFVAGASIAVWRGWGSNSVTTLIENTAYARLRSVTIQFKTCGRKGSIRIEGLDVRESRRLQYSVCGEGGQVIVAEFEDGHIVKSEEAYVESGYVVTASVSADAVFTHQTMY